METERELLFHRLLIYETTAPSLSLVQSILILLYMPTVRPLPRRFRLF